ncbi:hypothetical protein QFC19_000007 [Naganishia cerealis]|uniref:Uncharacterized protein n=1 Tax=Naganishia cerealis TaxID=610337 RepID=A0ACC2WPW3_9TREE|nr:hypothetical protein QFC19_000007 [Naganishia cerealis]
MTAPPSTQTKEATDKSAEAGAANVNGAKTEKKLEHLGALEEDDEFEEFPAEDWPESSTTLAALTSANAATGAGHAQDPSAQLWEDNWDDDDKELPFTQQLRTSMLLCYSSDPDDFESSAVISQGRKT